MNQLRYLLLTLLSSSLLLTASNAQEVILKGGQSITLRIAGVPAEDVRLVSGAFSISDGGTIRLPYLKTGIMAAGLRPSDLARKIESVYKSAQIYTSPNIQVSPGGKNREQRFISVLGEVKAPGTITSVVGLTMLDAIAQTSGFTDFAKTKKVKLTRGSKVTYHDLSKGDPRENVTLQANDIVTVR
ncbi:MAG: protein involved in polysaccharide export with SLBB domain [Verrucomicrobiales bacterium]|jgi:protein involved in polysaccharide export with SLBB domain